MHGASGSRSKRRQSGWVKALAFAGGCVAIMSSIAFGCGLDDTAITQLGIGSDATITIDGASSDAKDETPPCAAKTCDSYPSDCHASLPDGCGKTIDCSAACPSGQACVADAGAGIDAGFFCNGPPLCKDAGAPGGNCNTLTNPGNGLTTNCGNCMDTGFTCASNTCGCNGGTTCTGGTLCCITSSGTPNCNDTNSACCARKTCSVNYAGTCSPTNSDGCGGNISCSGACGAQVCDGTNDMCCTAESNATACSNANACNTNVMNNCHQTVPCGACASGTCANNHTCCSTVVCNGLCCTSGQVCFSNSCCTPNSMAMTCGAGCGNPVVNNCGQNVNCGTCSDGQVCEAATCPCGSGGGQVTCNQNQTCHISGMSGNGSCSG